MVSVLHTCLVWLELVGQYNCEGGGATKHGQVTWCGTHAAPDTEDPEKKHRHSTAATACRNRQRTDMHAYALAVTGAPACDR